MTKKIVLGDIVIELIQKDIKNVHLSVYPPTGAVRISAPNHMSLDSIRAFAISKLGWINRVQGRLRDQERETPREYLDRESHFVWGNRHLLRVVETKTAPSVELKRNKLVLSVRPGTDVSKKRAVVEEWYRNQIKEVVPTLVEKWEDVLGVRVTNFYVRQMKTLWGSCNPAAGNIRFNSELAKKPRECLEYVLVHEMVHLLEPTHGQRFVTAMDQFIPSWRTHKDALNRSAVRHENWLY